jgi:hypothetical protein
MGSTGDIGQENEVLIINETKKKAGKPKHIQKNHNQYFRPTSPIVEKMMKMAISTAPVIEKERILFEVT